jgi:hypothetical protein
VFLEVPAEVPEFWRIQLRCCERENLNLLARVFANIFSPRGLVSLEIFFSSRRLPQPQRKPEVRANRFAVIDNLSKQLVETPLTRVLAGVESSTRLTLIRWCTCGFGREISDIQNKIAVRLGSSLRLKTT